MDDGKMSGKCDHERLPHIRKTVRFGYGVDGWLLRRANPSLRSEFRLQGSTLRKAACLAEKIRSLYTGKSSRANALLL
jgi:hypothetical protein